MEISCDITQNASCYGTVGQPLCLQVITKENAQRIHQDYEVNLRKSDKRIQFKKNSTSKTDRRWSFFFNNGTIVVNPLEKTDFGKYRTEIYMSNGTSMASNNVEFVINGK